MGHFRPAAGTGKPAGPGWGRASWPLEFLLQAAAKCLFAPARCAPGPGLLGVEAARGRPGPQVTGCPGLKLAGIQGCLARAHRKPAGAMAYRSGPGLPVCTGQDRPVIIGFTMCHNRFHYVSLCFTMLLLFFRSGPVLISIICRTFLFELFHIFLPFSKFSIIFHPKFSFSSFFLFFQNFQN